MYVPMCAVRGAWRSLAGGRRRHSAAASQSIPFVDISPFLSPASRPAGTDQELRHRKRETAATLGAACENVGFFYVTNHGVDPSLVTAVQQMARRFFEQDAKCKAQAEMKRVGPSIGRGYQQLVLKF
jgi:isopenicillin N synthase-like dioxygenase